MQRGRGIVTRVPLILQLVRSRDGDTETWGEFVHDARLAGHRFSDFGRIKQTIIEETDRIAGKQRGVSSNPIVLRISSPTTVPLTLVDTPGLTRIAVEGQPADIESQIKQMVSSFIERPNSIILAVSPGTQDIATSDSLRLARTFDPQGERTIGVLTKLDLMDRGTDALDVLAGRVLPLRMGFVGVVCRSQQDIDSGKPLQQSLQDETRFFASSPAYGAVADVNGINHLAVKVIYWNVLCLLSHLSVQCNKLLVAHIRKVLPKLKANIKDQIRSLNSDLERIGDTPAPTDVTQRGYLLLRLIGDFANAFRAAIDGQSERDLSTPGEKNYKLNGGARIRYIFSEVFDKGLERIDPLDGLEDRDIQAAIRNAAGPKPAIFLPEAAFEMLVKRQIRKLLDPALECIDRVHSELLKIMLEMETSSVTQFPALGDKVLEAGQKMLRKTTGPTVALIREIVEAECSFINTQHKDFVGLQILTDPAKYVTAKSSGGRSSSSQPFVNEAHPPPQPQQSGGLFSSLFGSRSAPSPPPQTSLPSASESVRDKNREITMSHSPSERELVQISLLKMLLQSYFGVVRKNIQDITVKLVWRNVVEKAKNDLQRQLMSDLYKPELFDVLMRENPQLQSQRVILKERLAALRQAKEVISLQEVRGDRD